MKNRSLKIILSLSVILIFSGAFSGKTDIYFEVTRGIDLFTKVYKEIAFNYVDQIDPRAFMNNGIDGMLQSLDPYTVFIDEDKEDQIELMTNGKYGGIGVSIGIRSGKITIVEVLEGYSASRQGIRVGDVITKVDSYQVSAENIKEVSNLVKGEPGTSVEIEVMRNSSDEPIRFVLVREEITLKSLPYYGFVPEEDNVAYFKLRSFSRAAGNEFRQAIRELKSKREIKAVVVDLRGNPGGLLDIAVDALEKFLEKGQLLVSTMGRDSSSLQNYFAEEDAMLGDVKLVALVNGNSASASEIFAGAVQDHDRGVILGTKTFGKGLVQTIIPLSYNTSLKITTARYYTPSGRSIQKIDYWKNNDVIVDPDSIIRTPFDTDRNRKVYSAGGITPDTIIVDQIEGEINKVLLAKGYFFNFASDFYYDHPDKNYGELTDEFIFESFKSFLKQEKFSYESEWEKKLFEVIEYSENSLKDNSITDQLKEIQSKLKTASIDNKELSVYKDEAIRLLRSELTPHYFGSKLRIEKMLKYDLQFQAALDILNDQTLYNKILNRY